MIDDDNESDCDDDDEDEDNNRSISSESTSCGEFNKESMMLRKSCEQASADFEIWRLFQVDDQNMKDITNSEAVLSILTACDSNGNVERTFNQISNCFTIHQSIGQLVS